MNVTESFDQFAQRVSAVDLALYAGVGLIIWVLFKDKVPPLQKLAGFLSDKVKSVVPSVPVVSVSPQPVELSQSKEDLFFALVSSWKQTRDLAVSSGCNDAVKAADEMFPYLSPQVCQEKKGVEKL
jgi:hypothetical protein